MPLQMSWILICSLLQTEPGTLPECKCEALFFSDEDLTMRLKGDRLSRWISGRWQRWSIPGSIWAPIANRTIRFLDSCEMVSTPTENIAIIEYFEKIRVLIRFRPCNSAGLQCSPFQAGGVRGSVRREGHYWLPKRSHRKNHHFTGINHPAYNNPPLNRLVRSWPGIGIISKTLLRKIVVSFG